MQCASRFSKVVGAGAAATQAGGHIRGSARIISLRNPGILRMSEHFRLGVVMDPIDTIKYAKDSTLAMLLAAQARGFDLAYLEQSDLSLRDGVAFGRTRQLTVRADANDWFTLGEPRLERLGQLDAILMRKDPPFDTEYIYSTYVLERAEVQGSLIVNRPQGLRDM